jgi:capsular exopolysaccharide synthesis family protein
VEDYNASDRFDLRRALMVVRRQWWLVALCVLATVAAAFGYSSSQEKQYTATASVLLHDTGVDQSLLSRGFAPPVDDPLRAAETDVKVISSPTIALRTAAALHRPLGDVSGKVTVSPEGQTNVVDVKATDHDPHFAARLANEYVRRAIAFRRHADRVQALRARAAAEKELQALTPARQNSPEAQVLQSRIEDLNLFAAAQTGDASVVDPARVPETPSAPRTARSVLLGGLLGLLLGLGAAALAERLSRRVHAPEELSDLHEAPVLVDVPQSRALKGTRDEVLLGSSDQEAFRMLRARLRYFNPERKLRSLLVTSAGVKEGKSTVAWHLAEAAALAGAQRVLIIEADLRGPVLAARHGLRPEPGLAEILTKQASLKEATQPVWRANGGKGFATLVRMMDVIVAGRPPRDPAALIESEAMAELLDRLTAEYDLAILDTVPTSVVADALPLITQVDGVLVVSRIGLTTRDQAARLRDQLRAVNAPILGLVANGVRRGSGERYGYYPDAQGADLQHANNSDGNPFVIPG